MKIQLTPSNHLVYGRKIDSSDTVQHEFNELSGDDMRKRQSYCQVTFKHFTKRFLNIYQHYRRDIHIQDGFSPSNFRKKG